METTIMQKHSFFQLARSVSRIYSRQGESEECVRHIQRQVSSLIKKQRDANLWQQWSDSTAVHRSLPCLHSRKVKVALHSAQKGYVIPAHAHPGSLNIICVLEGGVLIDQSSLFDQNSHFMTHVFSGHCCAGLSNYKNIHAIRTLSKKALFISIRIRRRGCQQFLRSQLIPWLFSCALFLPACGNDSDANISRLSDNSLKRGFLTVALNSTDSVMRANQLRLTVRGEDDDNAYQAAYLYLQAAKNGNREAQYWVGAMYLDGVGITEDTDEALRWIAASAEQNYQPAKDLLKVLLESDALMDC